MSAARRLTGPALKELAQAKVLGVRAGAEHRYTGVWVVVVEGRDFVRSWNDKPTGWYRAFRAEPLGSIQRSRAFCLPDEAHRPIQEKSQIHVPFVRHPAVDETPLFSLRENKGVS
jgi:hypothetical protein